MLLSDHQAALPEDKHVIQKIVSSLLHELRVEYDDLAMLSELSVTYRLLYNELGNHLNSVPDSKALTVHRKNIKVLKSKLRHKLADKVDIEEVRIVKYVRAPRFNLI